MAFKTVLAAHEAFYRALGSGDIQLMTQVWSPSEDAVCIHPLWPPLIGQPAIMTSWREMFIGGSTMTVDTQILSEHQHQEGCIQLVSETLSAPGRPPSSPVLATNAYELTDGDWLMILHHASPTATVEPSDTGDHSLH